MPDDMKSAFEKAGYKPQRTSAANTQSRPNNNAAAGFVLSKDYASQADRIIKSLKEDRSFKFNNFTTSKIRNILTMVSEIYNDVVAERNDVLSPDLQSRIEYLKVRLVYESGRERDIVKPFVERAGLLKLLDGIGDSKKNFIDFARYMEALVAYHRFHGGRD